MRIGRAQAAELGDDPAAGATAVKAVGRQIVVLDNRVASIVASAAAAERGPQRAQRLSRHHEIAALVEDGDLRVDDLNDVADAGQGIRLPDRNVRVARDRAVLANSLERGFRSRSEGRAGSRLQRQIASARASRPFREGR